MTKHEEGEAKIYDYNVVMKECYQRLGESQLSKERYDYLFKLFQLYSKVQIDADTIYHQRTSVITLTQGLLFLAFQAVGDSSQLIGRTLIATVGLVLSILWFFFEQRNLIFFEGRGKALVLLERVLMIRGKPDDVAFFPFWTLVPAWVKKNARKIQRFSSQLIQRTLIPGLFAAVWLSLLLITLVGMS